MTDYIKRPQYIDEIKYVQSQNLKKINFSKYYIIKDDHYDLDLLRDIYKDNRESFFNIRDELLLRNFYINTKSKSSFFPRKNEYESKRYIFTLYHDEKYQNIDFNSLGLGNFINRFNVKNDLFFNYIPINNFKYLNNNIDLDLLVEEFKKRKFQILSSKEVSKKIENVTVEEPITVNKTFVKIKDYFDERKFNMFVEYCESKGLNYLYEINKTVLNNFKGVKFVGKLKYKAVKEKLEEFKNIDPEKLSTVSDENINNDEPFINIDDILKEEFLIIDYFKDNKYNTFLTFCSENRLEYLEDISSQTLQNYKNTKGIGKVKYTDVVEQIQYVQNNLLNDKNYIFSYNTDYFDLHEYTVNDILAIIGLNKNTQQNYIIENIFQKDIRSFSISNDEKKILYQLSNLLNTISKPNDILSLFINNLDNREHGILNSRFRNKETLQITGDKFGITRERVRQIESQIIENALRYLKDNYLKESLILSFISFDYSSIEVLEIDDFSHFIEKENLFILEIFSQLDDLFYYEDTYDLFFLTKQNREDFLTEMDKTSEKLPELFVIEEIEEIFQTHYFRDGLVSIKKLILENDYIKSGKIYSQTYLTLEDILVFLFKRNLPTKVTITDENYNKMIKLAKKEYNYKMDNPIRSVDGALRRSEKFILVDSNTYQLLDIEDYDLGLLDKCVNYCEDKLKIRKSLNASELFTVFKEKLIHTQIENKLHLYSILKHLYSDKFIFGKGNTLNIYNEESNRIDEIDLLKNYLNENNGIRTKKEIRNHFKWSNEKIDLKIYSNKDIISWGNHEYRIITDWISPDNIQEVKKIINDFFNKQGFITENQLFEEAHFSENLYMLIEEESIDSSSKFRSSFRPYIEELAGLSIIILPKNPTYGSIYDVILNKFNNGVTRERLYEYLRGDLLLQESTANSIYDEATSQEIIVEINLGFLYPGKNIKISDEDTAKILEYIEQEKNDKPYVILKKLEGYRSKLPKINLEWTPYLLKYVLLNNGYKNIKIFNKDYRTDQLILTEENNDIDKLDELLYLVLKNEYKGNMHESSVANYLQQEGFIYAKSMRRKKIPISIYKNSELIDVSELGRVKLGGKKE